MNFADDTQHHAIVGANGSGKTQAAIWHLSRRNFTEKPWLVYNFKGDESIDGIPFAHHIDLDEIPRMPGIFIVHPKPHEAENVESQMWEIWNRENMGIYVDEGYMIGTSNRAYQALLTQGRSKHIPMINLSQRPVFMNKFVFTESGFFQVFRLQSKEDVKKMGEYVPGDMTKRLPPFHSYYYDVKSDAMIIMQPVPGIDEIYDTFQRRLEKLRVKKVV